MVLVDGRGLVMDYPCAKFGDFSFSCFGFIVRTNRQTDRITHTHTQSYTDAAKRFTPATVVGVSNDTVVNKAYAYTTRIAQQ